MTKLPSFDTYGNYSSENYGAHALVFTDADGNCYWFSYKTLVAFQKWDDRLVVRQNDWGTTTGKHLNAIDGGDKKTRLPALEFDKAFEVTFGRKLKAA